MKMGAYNYLKTHKQLKDGGGQHTEQVSGQSVILISTNDETTSREQIDTSLYEKIDILSNQLNRQRIVNFFVACSTLIPLCLFAFYIVTKSSKYDNKNQDFAYFGNDDKAFQENLNSDESIKSLKEHIFCTPCNSIRGIEQQFLETVDKNRCCLKDISSLIHMMKSMDIKRLNEFSTELDRIKSIMNDVREDTKILTKELFNSNETTNDTDKTDGEARNERIMWSMITKTNRLLNLILNRRRSALYLIGTVIDDSIYWSVELESGDLSYDGHDIHVNSGGQYVINSNIHFSKNVCNGTENFGYFINKEYRPGVTLPIARARMNCVTGRSIDQDLRVETVFQVGLGERLKLHLQYDKHVHPLISNAYRSHHIIIYEI